MFSSRREEHAGPILLQLHQTKLSAKTGFGPFLVLDLTSEVNG